MKRMQKGLMVVAMLTLLVMPFLVQAQTPATPADLGLAPGDNFSRGLKLGQRGLPETIASIINAALALLGVVAVVIILMGGFMWMTAAGNDDKVKTAQKLIRNGVIGLAIILTAYAIATFVITKLTDATSGRI